MTNKEAVADLEKIIKLKFSPASVPISMRMAIQALENKAHGKWEPITRGEPGYSAGDFRCSLCLKPNKAYSLTKYCPNCGAEMER